MTYQVLARKWRPKDFASLVGQEHVVRALTHALDQNRLHHAYLFTGTRGVGKTTLSRILAKALNCETGITSTPCGVCPACRDIDAGRFVDYVEMDAASNRGVDEMAALLERAVYAPVDARFKVYMIDEVHMLTNHAFNAMLKTLEEPPAHVKFILATTDPQKIPVTVLSRCLQFNLKQMPAGQIVDHLGKILAAEEIDSEPQALRLLARAANGSMRDALSLTDQAIAYSAGRVGEEAVRGMLGALDQSYLVRLLDAVADGSGPAVLAIADEMAGRSLSFSTALQDLASLLHRVAWAQFAPGSVLDEWPEAEDIRRFAAALGAEFVQLYYQIATVGRSELSLAPDGYAGFTMTLLRMLAFQPAGSAGMPAGPATSSPTGRGAVRPIGAGAVEAGVAGANVVAAATRADAAPANAVAPASAHASARAPSATAPADAGITTTGVTGDTSGLEVAIVTAVTAPVTTPASASAGPTDTSDTSDKSDITGTTGATDKTDKTDKTDTAGAIGSATLAATVPARTAQPPEGAGAASGGPARAALDLLRSTGKRAPPGQRQLPAAPVRRVIAAGPVPVAAPGARPPSGASTPAVQATQSTPATHTPAARGAASSAPSASDAGSSQAAAAPNAQLASTDRIAPGLAPWEEMPPDDDEYDYRAASSSSSFDSDFGSRPGGFEPAGFEPSGFEADASGGSARGAAPPARRAQSPVAASAATRAAIAEHSPASRSGPVPVDLATLPPGISLAALGHDGDWPSLAAALPLTGVAYQLAFTSELLALEGTSLRLRVPVPQYADAAQVTKLKAALAAALHRPVDVAVEVGTALRTAAAVDAARRAELQRQAEQAIDHDPFVQSLIKEFDATIVPGSIRPLASDAPSHAR